MFWGYYAPGFACIGSPFLGNFQLFSASNKVMSQENESTPSPQIPESNPQECGDDAAAKGHSGADKKYMTPYAPLVTNEGFDASQEKRDEAPSESEPDGSLNFMEHLEEIRSRLIKTTIALLVVTALCATYADFLVNEILIGPLKRSSEGLVLQNLVPYGQVSLYFQVVFFAGFIISFPFIAWQIWQFVAPGLHEHERKASRFSILFISLCFFAGIAFGYFVFLPISLQFFAGFGTSLIKNNISVQDYVSFFIGTLLTAGLVFELPFISYILSKIGLLTPAFMKFYRKHAIVFLLIVAAVVTPSTDLVTQLIIGLPMILLYELSILISARVNRNNAALR